MAEPTRYYVVKKKRCPRFFEGGGSQTLLESEKVATIQDAVDAVGISRSSFYKYKDDIFPFHDNSQGRTITLSLQTKMNRAFCRMCSR